MRTFPQHDARMSVPATILNFQRLRRFDGPEFFLGGGFLAGLLVFLVWLATLPDDGKRSLRARGAGDATADAIAAPGRGVLSGITGQSRRSGRAATSSGEESGFFGEEAATEDEPLMSEADIEGDYASEESDSMAVGEDVGAPVQLEEGAALADSLLGPPAPPVESAAPGSAPGAPLLPYYVEVEVAPGQVQVLQLNAESPEHARAILRDFRGDPHILRGPTLEPLE